MTATLKPLRLQRGTNKPSLNPTVMPYADDCQICSPNRMLSVLINPNQWRQVNLNNKVESQPQDVIAR